MRWGAGEKDLVLEKGLRFEFPRGVCSSDEADVEIVPQEPVLDVGGVFNFQGDFDPGMFPLIQRSFANGIQRRGDTPAGIVLLKWDGLPLPPYGILRYLTIVERGRFTHVG